jgi:TRAP-type C4-dicarboxylate transport system permease small subunit
MVNDAALSKLIDRFEYVLSFICFTTMLSAVLIQVFYRYVLGDPLVWPYELSIYCYIYIVFFGAVMAVRRGSHISFNMLYDRLSERLRHVVRIATDIFVIVLFIIIIPSSLNFIELFGSVRSSSLDIPMRMILVVFPVSILLIVIQVAIRMAGNIQALKRMGKVK